MLASVCDDNMVFATQIENVILKMKVPNLETEVYASGEELCKNLNQKSQIYFLDIEMPGIDGIETARRIREQDQNALIVFMTQHHEYVFSVFEVLPFRFLRKPFTNEEVEKNGQRVSGTSESDGTVLFLQNGSCTAPDTI